ncbi:hypothetical protein J4421_01300 [Candidatus Woesearchaeota archaeon]|nr:hypothetical protein [Candidatus Woesearchaeota archaeon]
MKELFRGYQQVEEGRLYVRPAELEGVSIREVLISQTFIKPTEDAVIAYLSDKATEILPQRSLAPSASSKEVLVLNLDGLIRQLSLPTLKGLQKKEKEYTDFVRENTPASSLPEGEQPSRYVHVGYGIITEEVIALNKPKRAIDLDFYEKAFEQLSGNLGWRVLMQWKIEPQIESTSVTSHLFRILKRAPTPQFKLPPRKKTHLLVHNKTPEEISALLNVVYNGISFALSHNIPLRDTTHYRLEQATIQAVRSLLQKDSQEQDLAHFAEAFNSGRTSGNGDNTPN